MKLNFQSIFKPITVTVPILNKSFLYNKKRYSVDIENGWYEVSIENDTASIISPCYNFDTLKTISGYTYNNHVLFSQFDVVKRKYNLPIQTPLFFNNESTFSSIRVCVWEDKRAYYVEPNYSDLNIYSVKSLFDEEKSLDYSVKNVTPELRMLYMFHSIERENTKKLLEAQLKAEEEKKLLNTIPGRLKVSFDRVGAQLLDYSLSGNRIIVDWLLTDSGQKFNSVIDANTWKVVECGFCCSNEDKKHNITSMVKLAESYDEKDLIYITRRS